MLFIIGAVSGFLGQLIEPPFPTPVFSIAWWQAVSDDVFIALLYFTFSAPVDAAGNNILLHIARFVAPLATVSAIVQMVVQAAYAKWLQAQLRYRRGHVVIVGFGKLGQEIARHFLQHGDRVIALDPHPTPEATDLSERLKVPLVIGDGANAEDLEQVSANNAGAIFLVTNNDIVNLEASAAASSIMSHTDKHETRLLVHLGNLDLSRQLEDYERRLAFIGDRTTSVTFFNYHDLLARQLLAQNPLYDIANLLAQSRVHVLIIGLHPISEKLIQHVILSQRTSTLDIPLFTIIDEKAEDLGELYAQRYPGLADVAELNLITADPQKIEFSQAIRNATTEHPVTATILSLKEEVENLAAALEIHAAAARGLIHAGQILVHRDKTTDFFEMLSRIERFDLANMLHDFGEGDHELFVGQISGDDDRLSKRLHDAYCLEREKAGDPPSPSTAPWEELPESARRANRRAADHLWTKLANANYRMMGKRLGIPVLGDGGEALRGEEMRMTLSRLEHDRWWADRIIDGWTFAETRNNEVRHHPALVPFENLSDAVKQMDTEQVDFLTECLTSNQEDSGTRLLKESRIGLSFGEGGEPTSPEDAAASVLVSGKSQAYYLFTQISNAAEEAWVSAFEKALKDGEKETRLVRLFKARSEEGTSGTEEHNDDMWLNLDATGDACRDGYPIGMDVEAYLKVQCTDILRIKV